MPRATLKADAEDKKQLRDMAFSIKGYGVELPTEHQKEVPILINAKEVSSTPFLSIVKKNPQQFVAPMVLSETETAVAQGVGAAKFLHVGWYLPGVSLDMSKLSSDIKQGSAVGLVPSPLSSTATFQPQPGLDISPLFAVLPLTGGEYSTAAKYYALAGGKDKGGLRQPYLIPQDSVFYLHLYRDETSAQKNRGPAWSTLAQKMARKLGGQPEAIQQTSRQVKYKRGRDTTRLILEPNLSFANEVTALVSGYDQTRDLWMLSHLSKVLKEAEINIKYMPVPPFNATRAFFTKDREMDEGIIIQAHEEISARWPDIQHLCVEHLALVKIAMHHFQVDVPVHHARPFLVEVMYQLREGADHPALHIMNDGARLKQLLPWLADGETEDVEETGVEDLLVQLAQVVKEAESTVSRLIPSAKSTVSIPNTWSDQVVFLGSLLTKLKEIEKAAATFDFETIKRAGDDGTSAGPAELWESYARSFDVDHAKIAFQAVAKWFGRALIERSRGLESMLKEIIEIIEQVVTAE